MDAWLDRPAEYQDVRRSLHFILYMHCGYSLSGAIMFNPHSMRHFLMESGQQLRAMDVCSSDDLERLGRWAKGSSMPETYDNQAGVSDLMARHKVLEEIRKGWRPVESGNLPNRLVASGQSRGALLVPVAHAKRRRIHLSSSSSGRSLCGMW